MSGSFMSGILQQEKMSIFLTILCASILCILSIVGMVYGQKSASSGFNALASNPDLLKMAMI